MRSFGLDLRAAVRGLLRNRSLTVMALVCLALGLGVSSAMLGLLDSLLFRPPAHVQQPERVRRVYFTDTVSGLGEVTASQASYPILRDLEKVRAFSSAGAFFATEMPQGRGAEARKLRTVLATPGFFRLLGVQPVRGRLFAAAEGEPGRPALVALLGYDLWRRGFGGADVLGRQVVLGSVSYTIVGVLPSRFTGVDLESVDLWLPMNAASGLLGPRWAERRGNKFLEIVVRLRNGVTAGPAGQEATTVFRAGAAEAGRPSPQARVRLTPIQRAQGPDAPRSLPVVVWLAGLSWIVLLVSCANVASLLLLRGLDRRRELGLRLALGAGSGRLARLMVCEGVVLAGLGGIAALLACPAMGIVLQRWILPEVKAEVVPLDLRTLGLVAVLVAIAALLSGAVPALWASRRDLISSIRSGGRERSPGSLRLDVALATAQIALTLALLVGAGAFARSLYNVLHLDLGIDTDRLVLVTLDLESAGYPPARVDEILHRAAERVRLLVGVRRQSLAATIPFATSREEELIVPGVERMPETESGGPSINAIAESFFATTGTRLLRGRAFTSQDRTGTAPVAIVNQTMARRLWPGRDALGQCLKIGGNASPCSTVVGVVQDARRSDIQESPALQYYIPLSQAPAALAARALLVRAAGDPSALIGPLRRAVLGVAPDLPFVEVQPLADLVAPQVRPWRLGAAVLALFGLLALALASVGLYGVVAHALARRHYEMGVRMALGARWRQVLWLALRHGLAIGGLGALTGLGLALGAARYLQPLLFHVSAKDPLVLAGATLLVIALALLASYVPSRRLRRLDLATVLRVE